MAFLTIVPKTKKIYNRTFNTKYHLIQDGIPLKVVVDSLEETPDINVKTTDLNGGKKHFFNASGEGDVYKMEVVINKHDYFEDAQEYWHFETWMDNINGTKPNQVRHYSDKPAGLYKDHYNLMYWLNRWIKEGMVFIVTCKGADMKDGEYIITKNSKRKQILEGGNSIWELEFTKYVQGETVSPKKQSNNKNTSSSSTTKKEAEKDKIAENSNQVAKLKKCKAGKGGEIKYSKEKKVVECVKLMQWVLIKLGYYKGKMDGWFGDDTVKAVTQFQKDHKDKYQMKVDGKVGVKTLRALTTVRR